MEARKYAEEFKLEAVRQVKERGYPAKEVAERLGVHLQTLYEWCRKYANGPGHAARVEDQQTEIRRLRAELKRVTEERDILKKAAAYFAKESR